MSIFRIAIAFALMAVPTRSDATVWPIHVSKWTAADEVHFSNWVATAMDRPLETILSPSGPLAPLSKLEMDCADFVYGVRILYAAEHGLPFVSKATGKDGLPLVDATTSAWDHFPAERRLTEFLKFAFNQLNTNTLIQDTAPIENLGRHSILPGTLLLAAPQIGHSWLVRKVRSTGIPELLFASVPKRTEVFLKEGLPRGEAVFGKSKSTTAGGSGFRRWTPGRLADEPPAPLPHSMRPSEWRPFVLKSLQVEPEPLIEAIGRELNNLCRESRVRAKLVLEAQTKRQNGCLNPADRYNYSTPNRDSRLKEGFLDLWEIWMTANELVDSWRGRPLSLPRPLLRVLDQIDQVFSNQVINEINEDVFCPIEINAETILSLRDVRSHTLNGRLSVDPNESVRARWGLDAEIGLCR